MDYNFLTEIVLFTGASPDEVKGILEGLRAKKKTFKKGTIIYRAGDKVQCLGIVLSGSVNIENDDAWGNKSILDNIGPGRVFAKAYACLLKEPLMVSVAAAEDVDVLFLNVKNLMDEAAGGCACYQKLIRNLLIVTAEKNITLSRRIFHTSAKTIRGRLLSYLSFQAVRQGTCEFTIPFNRQQLADYLGVDRSAMSHELSKMQRDGLLTVDRNRFCILEKESWTVPKVLNKSIKQKN